ncbi:MFS transporter [Aestuariimicrobium sp. T2.26MG-19.2B]|uniref:MFS transporter n=1 Tax=Aestuariimicrobium sp. T2.26MG-19.2B TaxID=3040679 RepID=UPI0024779186|nr:MFS transporter [Aestuariimicrobium sp. T2.26MG-19.2B]CAI9402259.1 Enterobactin exporter EntS [Aestuariimicrobium sp. T2.26MG-19.2B]
MSSLRSGTYRWWLVSDSSGVVGGSLRGFAVPLVVYLLSGSPVWAGAVGTSAAVITTIVSLPGGVIVDRYDRGRLVRLYALGCVVIWGSVTGLGVAGLLTWPIVFAAAVVGAVLAALFGSATDAALRSVVDVEDFPGAMAVNQGRDAGIRLAAGPLGGLLLGLTTWLPFAGTAVAHLIQGITISRVATDLAPPTREPKSVLHDLLEGLRWMRGQRVIIDISLIAILTNFGFGGALFTFNLVLLANGHTPFEVGILDAASAVAALIGSLFAARLVSRLPTGVLVIGAIGVDTLLFVPAVVWQTYPVLIAVVTAVSFVVPALNASALGYLFGRTPVELQGRMQSVLGVVSMGLGSLAPGLAGLLLHSRSAGLTIGVFVAVMVLATVMTASSRAVRTIPRPTQW